MINRRQLTSKQYAFLHYIQGYIQESGEWPSYGDIIDEFGYRSPNSVTQNLQALVKKGYLRRDDNGYHFPDEEKWRRPKGIPIKGTITAGVLQEAIEGNDGVITLETLFPNINRIFALRVSGNSMIGDGIEHGNFVLLIDDDIPEGGIGAVLYNGETTLKRVYHEKGGIRLEAANEEFPDVHIHPGVFEEVRILGRYIGHVTNEGIYKRTQAA